MLFIFLNKELLLAIQEFILLMNSSYQFIHFSFCCMLRLAKRLSKSSSSSLELPSSLDVVYLGVGSRLYLLFLVVLCHEAFVADIGEEKSFVDGDVCGILIGGGVGGAHVGVPFPTHMGITALLLAVLLLFLLPPLLVVVPVTITRHRAFSDKMTGLTTFVAHPLGAGFVVLPPPLLEDLVEALDDERHLLVVELGGIDWDSTWRRFLLFFLRRLECDGLHLGCGGVALLQVDDMFGAFDHQLKAHKLSYYFLGRH
jgi:hypothetical protein